MAKEKNSPDSQAPEAEAPKVSTKYKQFDEFEAVIKKESRINPYTNQNSIIILGWDLRKKIKSLWIEPHIAQDFNSFATGMDNQSGDGGSGKMYWPFEEKGLGGFISYKEFAEFQGMDTEYDQNVFLTKEK